MTVDAGELKVSVAKPAAGARRLTITVPAARIERERRGTAEEVARSARLPGFRKGKVPAHVIEKRYGPLIERDTLEKVVNEAYREAMRREGLQPITDASVGDVDYTAGADLTFNVDVEVRPEIELNRLGGFRVQRPVPVVEEASVNEVLERVRDQHAVWTPLEAGASLESGDAVAVEISELGETGEPGQPFTRELVLGQAEVAPRVEEAIRSLEIGQQGEFSVDLRTDPNDAASAPDLHRIRVSLLEARRADRPEVDDEFARAAGEFESLDDLRARIREDLQREAERDAERSVRAMLLQNIIDANPFEIPRSMIENYLDRMVPEADGQDETALAQFREAAWPMAERMIQRMLVVAKIAETEALRATPEEVEERVGALAERLGRGADEVRAQLRKDGRLRELEDEITENKVLDYLKSLSTIE